ncbi:MAG: hypothetical protein KAR20_00970 [Candidatus Heimdallarchaeota archaeon]|nr:hypothetical protein [Candidatus Heimdallarchaeota archaeon]
MPKITIEIKTVKLSSIHLNKDNPRTITEKDMEYLVKSLQDFPDMMKLREIVVDETMQILGGNMRFRGLQQIGEKTCIVKIVKGLTPEQKREFIIKDNGEIWGRWDFDALANNWDDLPLTEWGVKMHKFEQDDPEKEWEGMPECNQEDLSAFKSMTIHFKNLEDINTFAELIGQKI